MSTTDSKLRAAILIISDTAHAEPSSDKSTQILEETIQRNGDGQWLVAFRKIVPDDIPRIQAHIRTCCDNDEYMNLVVTSGGTGFAVKDVTPEAIKPLIQKEAPGLVHGMLAASLEITPFAMMSRPIAGVRNQSLIITLPGSPKGAKENLQAIIKLLPHACIQAAGGNSRSLHAGGIKRLEQEAGVAPNASRPFMAMRHQHSHDHSHTHEHGHGGHMIPRAHTSPEDRPVSNDPHAGPSRRYRESPYPMLSVEEATKLTIEHTPKPQVFETAVDTSLVGYILAEDVEAKEAVPAFRASIVDGYAVIVSKEAPGTRGVFSVASVSHASPGEIPALQMGQIARITTGAPLPPGATSVVMVEDTLLKSMTPDGQEEKEVEILTDVIKPGENVREIGSDISAGEVILKKGDEITTVGGELGLLASVGKAQVLVYKKPIVGVLSTGDEIIEHNRPGKPRLGEVRDCNRLTIMAAVKGWGYEVVDLGTARDSPSILESTLRTAFRRASVIITTGGASMGELDLLKPTIERSLGGTIHFGRVSMKPGKPTTFATVPFKSAQGNPESRLIFSLPGNPASALVTASLFVLPSLQAASGRATGTGMSEVRAVLEEAMRCDAKREEYARVRVWVGQDGTLKAQSTGGQRSSRVGSLSGANALVRLPAGGGLVGKGEVVGVLVMGRVGGS